jgi:SAM-dependent methyltransferase
MPAEVVAFVRAALPPPPARVLELGAGAGHLAATLSAAGYDVLAIDPASETETVVRVAVADVDAPAGSFDAAVAVVSLHHVDPLPESCRRLAELVRPGGRLVIDEFDIGAFDERAARWLNEERADVCGHVKDPAAMVAELRGHLHSVARLGEALAPYFRLGEPVRGAYLHRWSVPSELRATEEDLIAAGRLPATGARLIGTRRR